MHSPTDDDNDTSGGRATGVPASVSTSYLSGGAPGSIWNELVAVLTKTENELDATSLELQRVKRDAGAVKAAPTAATVLFEQTTTTTHKTDETSVVRTTAAGPARAIAHVTVQASATAPMPPRRADVRSSAASHEIDEEEIEAELRRRAAADAVVGSAQRTTAATATASSRVEQSNAGASVASLPRAASCPSGPVGNASRTESASAAASSSSSSSPKTSTQSAEPVRRAMRTTTPPSPATAVDRRTSHQKRRILLGLAALLGWCFFLIAAWCAVTSCIATLAAIAGRTGATAVTAGPAGASDGAPPLDPYGTQLPPCDEMDLVLLRTGRLMPPYPATVHREENRALASPCLDPEGLASAARSMLSGRDPEGKVKLGPRGAADAIGLHSLRCSLQAHVLRGGLDFLCAQALGVPLCYCVAVVDRASGRGSGRDGGGGGGGVGGNGAWLDLVGRANLTCLSTGATVQSYEHNPLCASPDVTSKRFKHACLEYKDLEGIVHERRMSGVSAVVAQQVFEVERGLDPCESSLDRTLAAYRHEIAAPASPVAADGGQAASAARDTPTSSRLA